MATPFDTALKELLEQQPEDWLRLLDLPVTGPAAWIDADLSTVATQADKVLRVQGAPAWLLHLEFQASRDASLPQRLLKYNVILRDRHELPVRSLVLLLRPAADAPALTGQLDWSIDQEPAYLMFKYHVLRLWQMPVDHVLASSVWALPLAPLTDVPPDRLPDLIHRIEERFAHETQPKDKRQLEAITFVLMGLRYPRDLISKLMRGVREMEESTTYQWILEKGEERGIAKGRVEGRVEGLRRAILRLGNRFAGKPSDESATALQAITDPDRLERMLVRAPDTKDWPELLATP